MMADRPGPTRTATGTQKRHRGKARADGRRQGSGSDGPGDDRRREGRGKRPMRGSDLGGDNPPGQNKGDYQTDMAHRAARREPKMAPQARGQGWKGKGSFAGENGPASEEVAASGGFGSGGPPGNRPALREAGGKRAASKRAMDREETGTRELPEGSRRAATRGSGGSTSGLDCVDCGDKFTSKRGLDTHRQDMHRPKGRTV